MLQARCPRKILWLPTKGNSFIYLLIPQLLSHHVQPFIPVYLILGIILIFLLDVKLFLPTRKLRESLRTATTFILP
jgi:hypothetical protein